MSKWKINYNSHYSRSYERGQKHNYQKANIYSLVPPIYTTIINLEQYELIIDNASGCTIWRPVKIRHAIENHKKLRKYSVALNLPKEWMEEQDITHHRPNHCYVCNNGIDADNKSPDDVFCCECYERYKLGKYAKWIDAPELERVHHGENVIVC